uniref:Integrin alpha-2 domain-containing protein n=1 Tax=Scophthalmus maximus TaxID=52904 RepID=A0A8D3BNJ5_SCOMX
LQIKRSAVSLSLSLYSIASNQARGFNLDTTHTLHKLGDHGTFFGFSLCCLLTVAQILIGLQYGNHHVCHFLLCFLSVSLDRESKDNQWLGVTVKSQGIGGKVVTCAHLYELRQRVSQPSETRDPIGRCYVLSEDLTERDDLDGGEWKFCEGRPQGHEQFGFCQQGMSVSFTPDNNFILFGAPGTYNWKGEMRVQLLNQTLLDLGFYDDGPYEVADQKQLNAQLIPVPSHSYLGFSVDSALGIMSLGELTFVAGAPRANHTGAVVLLRKDNVYRLVPQHIFWGEELASSFGYSVATTDLNRDGWTDLIVGAPNFFDRKAEIGGAVYVYLNPFGHWDDQARPIRLNGTYDSMFGMTVSNIGDLDQDGYGDIAVGAPYDGDGKVFIYRGSDSGIETKPAQVLDGRDFDVRRFGYSISGGLDIDNNQYPDIAVGSLNDSVVLFRSRPVIHVIRDISIDPQYIDLEQHNCKGRHGVCVEVKACFTFTAHPEHYSPHMTLVVHFEADTERRKLGLPHRVNFLGRSSLEPEYTQTEEVQLHQQRHPVCTSAVFQLIQDKLRPISLAITHNIKPVPPRRHSGAKRLEKLAPVLSVSPSNTLHSEVNFLREGCGSDKICQSNLKLSYQFGTRPLTSDLFTPLPKDEDDVQVFSLSDQRLVVLEITVTNMPSDPLHPDEDGDDAHAAQLLITLPNTLSYAGSRMICQANQNGSQVECDLGNPVKRDTKVKKQIQSKLIFWTGKYSNISEQLDLAPVTAFAKVVIELPLSVSGLARPHQLFFSGTVRGESAMTSLEDVGSPVDFEFVVANPGPALQTLGSAFLNIMWPYELANEKWLLYPASLKFQGHPDTHCAPTTALNPLKLQTSSPAEQNKIFVDCLLGSARCVLFQCPLHSFSGQAVLRIHARLWNSSFIEVRGEEEKNPVIITSSFLIGTVLSISFPGLADQYRIPWWIILIAILAGILLLTLLVCLLWKCGFFRRAHHQDKVPQYHAVKIPREDRPQFQTEKSGVVHKKEWATHWSDGTS